MVKYTWVDTQTLYTLPRRHFLNMAQAAIVAVCDVCETDQDVKFFCVDCEVNLCTSCKTHHSKIKKTKNDKIILLSEARNENITKTPVILCGDHSTEEVTIYCRECDQLICTECLIVKHKGHDIITLKQMKNTATDELVNLRKKLQERKKSYDDIAEAQGNVHTQYMTSLKQCKKGISDQKEKIIQELNSICEEEFAEISSMEEKETKRYSEVCFNIQKNRQIMTTALQTVQNGLDSGHPAAMLQAREEATKFTEELNDSNPAPPDMPEFQQATIEHQALRQNLGSIRTKSSGARPKQVTNTGVNKQQTSDVKQTSHSPTISRRKIDVNKQQTSDVKQTSHSPTISRREIDVKKVNMLSTMSVKGTIESIKVIIPTKNNCTWIAADGDKNLTLINNKGDTIQTSVKVSENIIIDAKPYNNDILVTCYDKQAVFRLSGDGKTKSTFSYLRPYKTWGLCVTNEMDVLVCLYLSTSDNKVVRLGKNGNIIQTIQKDKNGDPLYTKPYRVTALPSGEIAVTQDYNGNVVCVDRDGQHLFTWTGQVDGRQMNRFKPYSITHDNYHVFVTDFTYNKVYVLRKDGTRAKSLLDSTNGINMPWGVAIDHCGQLMVGCTDGKIHVFQY